MNYQVDIYDEGRIIHRLAHEPDSPIVVNTQIKVYDIVTDIVHLVHVDRIDDCTVMYPNRENPLVNNWNGQLVRAHLV